MRDGTRESDTLSSKAGVSELASAYNSGSIISCQHSLSTGDLSGLSPRAGVYCSEGGVFSLSDMSTLVLDAHNASDATWIFQTVGNLTSGLASKVILKNGASASNVYWVVGGNTNIGAGSSMAGNILSRLTIRIGASGNLDGRALSESSVIFEGHSSAVLPSSSSGLPFTLGDDLLKFVVLGGTSVSFGSDQTSLSTGSVGVSPGTTISGNYLLRDGTTESNTLTSKAGASELASAYNSGSRISCQHSLSTGDLSGLSPRAGVYCSEGGVFSLSGRSMSHLMHCEHQAPKYSYQTVGNLTSGLASKVILKNGASASNVYWVVGDRKSVV